MTRAKTVHHDVAIAGRIIAYVIALFSLVQILGPRGTAPADPTKVAGLTVGVIFIVVVAVSDVWLWRHQRRRSYPPNGPEIADYLCDWLESGGQAAIFSRQLGWVQRESRAEQVLMQKAREKKLILCLPAANEISDRLARAGAEVYTYPELGYNTPQSRFTIINFGRGDARVTAGGEIDGRHVMHESATGEDPFLSMAEDLISIVRASARRARPRR